MIYHKHYYINYLIQYLLLYKVLYFCCFAFLWGSGVWGVCFDFVGMCLLCFCEYACEYFLYIFVGMCLLCFMYMLWVCVCSVLCAYLYVILCMLCCGRGSFARGCPSLAIQYV